MHERLTSPPLLGYARRRLKSVSPKLFSIIVSRLK